MSTPTHHRASRTAAEELQQLLGDDLVDGLADDLLVDIERYLAAQRRTAHPLVTATTEELVAQALAALPAPAARGPRPPAGAVLPSGIWRILPDRLLALHPGRHVDRIERLQIPVATHLELTALVLEHWGWGQTDGRRRRHVRSLSGRRCILGAQVVLYRLGYGTQTTATEAGRYIQAALARRGVTTPFADWNENGRTDARQVLAVVRDAATLAR
jgi:hypothetical protein